MSAQVSKGRPTSWWRSSSPPVDWDGSTGPESGIIELPLRLYWSDRHNRFDLSDESERRLLYQIVLIEGGAEDVRTFLHMPTLLQIWDDLWLPAAVHEVWNVWIDVHRDVAV